MTPHTMRAVMEIIDMPLNCRCGECESRAIQILTAELEMCQGGKTEMSRRRNRVRRTMRRDYYRERYHTRKRGQCNQ